MGPTLEDPGRAMTGGGGGYWESWGYYWVWEHWVCGILPNLLCRLFATSTVGRINREGIEVRAWSWGREEGGRGRGREGLKAMSEGERRRVWPGRRVGVGGLGGTGSVRLAPVRGDLGASLQCLALCILPGSKWEEGAGKGRGGGLTVASHDPHPEWMLEPVLRCLPAVPQTPGCSMSRGGDSNMKMPGCVCWVSENLPILNGTFSRITYPYWRDPLHNLYPFFMLILS